MLISLCAIRSHGRINILFDDFFKSADSISTRRHPIKWSCPGARINARAHTFPVRVMSLWSRLPD